MRPDIEGLVVCAVAARHVRSAVGLRLFLRDVVLSEGLALSLPEGAARHVQVLRQQPGDTVVLFDGRGGEWTARVTQMGRRDVSVAVEARQDVDRELPVAVTLALGMPANDRMDALVEKAAELGVAAIQPLVCERSVLRLDGERAAKKVAHWQSVAEAACEQSGRTRVPMVHAVQPLKHWLEAADAGQHRALLSFNPQLSGLQWLQQADRLRPQASHPGLCFLSGPEGGLTEAEEARARELGWTPAGLGARVLRADTAPLMMLSLVAGQLS
ncbi:MAG TPA: 16S rRNA (uracil(1498)-N(3))-methyltransferase [Candidatus Aquabacterium excrementipullorum]|nr:16S rRNA (uracil(1498)-N(3))-methyltransferase [Candidatus Aquabacterium excrementipullorum]